MATPQTTPNTTAVQPLTDFQKIGHNTSVYTPVSYTHSSPLILFFSWMGAAKKHAAKYTDAYQRLFPNARIVWVQCELPDMFHSRARYRKLQAAALNVVGEHVKGSVEQGGDVLVHSSSNGGAKQVIELAKSWREMFGEALSMRAQILDSSPGIGDWQKSHAAISLSLPRNLFFKWFGSALVHIFIFYSFIFNTLLRRENDILVIRRELNDTALFSTRVPRAYLYSKADAMVGYEEVEAHANEAATKGWDVQKMRFENSSHAGHIREDEGKYWGAVMDAWNAGPRS